MGTVPKSVTSVELEIHGATYHLRSEHGQEYMQQLADLVNRKMQEIAERVSTVDSGKIAVLAAINLADELLQCTRQQEGERDQIMEKVVALTEELDGALEE